MRNLIHQTIVRTLAVAALAALPIAVSAQNIGDTLVPSQTVINGTLEASVNTKSAQTGDAIVLDVQSPYPGDDQRFANARVYGHVDSVTHAGGMKKGAVTFAFDRLVLQDGTAAQLQGSVISVNSQGNKANQTTKAIAGGVIGQVLGNYVGKHIGSNVGGAVGAIGGAVIGASSGQNVTVGQGSTVSLKTTAAATVLPRRQAGYPQNGQTPYPYGTPYPYSTPR